MAKRKGKPFLFAVVVDVVERAVTQFCWSFCFRNVAIRHFSGIFTKAQAE
jgi:hypothetical protein